VTESSLPWQPLSYEQASELESLQSILSLLTGWSATELDRAEHAEAADPETIARWRADSDRYAQLLRRLHQLPADQIHRLLEELAPVARRVVQDSR
jgi:hypothetical protein